MINAVEESTSSVFSTNTGTNTELGISLLDSNMLANSHDTRIAILRKVQYRNTKEGRPFIRASFEDINGYIIVGRMFDFNDMTTVGKAFNSMTGSLVSVTYDTDYFNGSIYLSLLKVTPVPKELAIKMAQHFVGKFNMAEERLRQCNTLLAAREFSDVLEKYRNTYCNLNVLIHASDESISNGLRGALIDVVYRTLVSCSTVSNETVLAFLTAVLTWVYTKQETEATIDENTMFFTASMAEKILTCKSQGMLVLANKISEIASMFTNSAKIISSDTYLIYNVYKTFVEASTIAVLESHLPAEGFCTYRSFTVRRS